MKTIFTDVHTHIGTPVSSPVEPGMLLAFASIQGWCAQANMLPLK